MFLVPDPDHWEGHFDLSVSSWVVSGQCMSNYLELPGYGQDLECMMTTGRGAFENWHFVPLVGRHKNLRLETTAEGHKLSIYAGWEGNK